MRHHVWASEQRYGTFGQCVSGFHRTCPWLPCIAFLAVQATTLRTLGRGEVLDEVRGLDVCPRRLKTDPVSTPNFDPLRLSLGLRAERRRELLAVEDWAEIRRLHRAEGLPIKLIARTLKVSRNTVRSALASDEPPKYVRKPVG